jgi:hypothetical protein
VEKVLYHAIRFQHFIRSNDHLDSINTFRVINLANRKVDFNTLDNVEDSANNSRKLVLSSLFGLGFLVVGIC